MLFILFIKFSWKFTSKTGVKRYVKIDIYQFEGLTSKTGVKRYVKNRHLPIWGALSNNVNCTIMSFLSEKSS